jgi:hypothetical protein
MAYGCAQVCLYQHALLKDETDNLRVRCTAEVLSYFRTKVLPKYVYGSTSGSMISYFRTKVLSYVVNKILVKLYRTKTLHVYVYNVRTAWKYFRKYNVKLISQARLFRVCIIHLFF